MGTGCKECRGEAGDEAVDEVEPEVVGNEGEDEDEDAAGDEDGDDGDDDDGEGGDNEDENEGGCSNWENGDSNGGDTPEYLFCVSGEKKMPACTMNATEEGAKRNEEQDLHVLGISMFWNVERRDVCGLRREE